MKDTFNWSRLMSLFAYDWATTWKIHAVYAALIVGCSVMTLLCLSVGLNSLQGVFIYLFFMITAFGQIFIASHTFANIRNKTGRINYLMLPATNKEKFIVRMVNMSIAPLLTAIIAWIISYFVFDVCTLFDAFDESPLEFVSWIYGDIHVTKDTVPILISLFIMVLLNTFSNNFYMAMGSLLFKRFVLIKMIFVTIGLSIVFSLLMNILSLFVDMEAFALWISDALNSLKHDLNANEWVLGAIWTVNLVHFILFSLYGGISYVLFRRKQVIGK